MGRKYTYYKPVDKIQKETILSIFDQETIQILNDCNFNLDEIEYYSWSSKSPDGSYYIPNESYERCSLEIKLREAPIKAIQPEDTYIKGDIKMVLYIGEYVSYYIKTIRKFRDISIHELELSEINFQSNNCDSMYDVIKLHFSDIMRDNKLSTIIQ